MSILNPTLINNQLTTFRTPIKADNISVARWPREFLNAYHRAIRLHKPLIILGQGSNVLFVEDFAGEIVLNQFHGIKVETSPDYYHLRVCSGVTIDELIAFCHRFKMYGLENLSSIPSSVGTAAISNIGAYGVEFEQFVEYVIVQDLYTGRTKELTHAECQFSYRNSIFKSQYRDNYAVIKVGIKIPKQYQPVLTYAPLNKLNADEVTPKQIQELVVATRKQKLPNFDQYGNGGSFFMNPIVSAAQYQELVNTYPDIVAFAMPNSDKIKLSAGWLIEHAGLKGYQYKNAQVSQQHALVLINTNQQATGREIAELAALVQHTVQQKFGVLLHPEIRFIGATGEVNATAYLQDLYVTMQVANDKPTTTASSPK